MLKEIQKKISVFLLMSMMAVLCFTTNSIPVQAEESMAIYTFAQKDGGEAKWYIGDPVIGYTEEISTDAMQKNANTIYYICAAPTPELNSFLQSLTSASAINFFECGAGSVSFGDAASPISIGNMQICDPDINVEATVSSLGQLSVDKGTVTINGNVSILQLGYDSEIYPSGLVTQNATINGDVTRLTWYSNPDLDKLSFKGNCTVTGTVASGEIKESADLPDFGEIYPTTRTFSNISNTAIISNGTLNPSIPCDGIDNLDTATITYEYHCYCWQGWTGNSWYQYAYADGQYLGDRYLDEFDPATIPTGADVSIYSTYGDEPIALSGSLDKLLVKTGNVNVTGDVNFLDTFWYCNDPTLYTNKTNLNITGNVTNMNVSGSCKEVNINVNGNITQGTRTTGTNISYFTSDGSTTQILKNGQLMIMANDSTNHDGVNYLLPGVTDLENILGITASDALVDSDGNTIAEKTAAIDIAELESVTDEVKKVFTDNNSSSVVSWLDIGMSSFYEGINGTLEDTIEEIHELTKPISITIEIPAEYQDASAVFHVLRNHNGVITELPDTDNDSKTVTFSTDKFSTYALAKANNTSDSNNDENNSESNASDNNNSDNNSNNNANAPQNSSSDVQNQSVEKSEPEYYIVVGGDTLTKIARNHNMTLKELVVLNPQIKDINKIYPGQKILIKEGTNTTSEEAGDITYHIVRSGDALYKISRQYRITLPKILELNPHIKNPNLIYVGQKIALR